jgi:hypothetical protein
MKENSSWVKPLLILLAGLFLSRSLQKREVRYSPTRKDDTAPWQALSPIRKMFWLRHPQRAIHFFMLQKSLGFTWKLWKKYTR